MPAIRTLEGEPRGRAMRELGLRWRPLGYGALLVLARHGRRARRPRLDRGRSPFQTVLWVKVGLSVGLVARVLPAQLRLGPRLQREIRDGRAAADAPALVVVGWTASR